jgi:predicted dehydrogenase
MRIAYVGCGYVADLYQQTLINHSDILKVAGVFDRDGERKTAFANYYSIPTYESLDALLADDSVDIVLNLTNPESHYSVSESCIAAGKHVYSEKPLAMDFEKAKILCSEARRKGVRLASAPCNLLGETAQTIWKELRKGTIGQVFLVYAALDGGLKHRENYRNWISQSGAPWPVINEFETGCTVEHAGYALTWLAAFFGPAKRLTSFSACLVPDKKTDQPLEHITPDFSVGCIEFPSGLVARITNSIVAQLDHSLIIFGEEGTLLTHNSWDYASPVYVERSGDWAKGTIDRLKVKTKRKLHAFGLPRKWLEKKIPPVRKADFKRPLGGHPMDFMRGVAELAESISEERPCRLSAELGLHVTEITHTLQRPEKMGLPRMIESVFEPIDPMPWGR